VAAISISGFDAQRFSFLGFLPRKPGKRRKALAAALARQETVALYESPFRVVAVLESIAEIAPQVQVVVSREITKQFEETLRGTAEEVLSVLKLRKELKGEFVIVIDSVNASNVEDNEDDD
jgi:16S rRNA (cytidine1402-2'-O)-methyltransferase